MKLLRILAVLAMCASASAVTPQTYAPGTLAASCSAVTTTGECTPLYLPGNSLAIGVTWQLSFDTGTASAVNVTLRGSNDNVSYTVLDTNTSTSANSRSLTVTSYKYLECNVVTYSRGTTNSMSCSVIVNPNGGTALGIHGIITPGDCTAWFNVTTLEDAGAPCGSGGGGAVWGAITGTLSDQTDLQTALNAKVATSRTVNGQALSANVNVPSFDAVANYGTGGTTLNNLACRTVTSTGLAVDCPANVKSHAVGVTVGGAGTTGSAIIQQTGTATLNFDSSHAVVIGDWVVASATLGLVADTGSTLYPTSGNEVIGTATTAGSASTAQSVALMVGEPIGGVLYSTQSAAVTTNISAATMYANPAATHAYAMDWTVSLTTAGTSCTGTTTVILNAIFTDPSASVATTLQLAVITLASSGNGNVGYLASGTEHILAKASTNIQYSTSSYTLGTACSPGPAYQVSPTLVQLW